MLKQQSMAFRSMQLTIVDYRVLVLRGSSGTLSCEAHEERVSILVTKWQKVNCLTLEYGVRYFRGQKRSRHARTIPVLLDKYAGRYVRLKAALTSSQPVSLPRGRIAYCCSVALEIIYLLKNPICNSSAISVLGQSSIHPERLLRAMIRISALQRSFG